MLKGYCEIIFFVISDSNIMALLTRYLQLNDSEDTHVFNFIVTKSVTRDSSKDVVSKDFAYGSHRWAISFSKHDKVILKYGKTYYLCCFQLWGKTCKKFNEFSEMKVVIYFCISNAKAIYRKCVIRTCSWILPALE